MKVRIEVEHADGRVVRYTLDRAILFDVRTADESGPHSFPSTELDPGTQFVIEACGWGLDEESTT